VKFLQELLQPSGARDAVGIRGEQDRRTSPLSAEVSSLSYATALRQVHQHEVLEWRRVRAQGIATGVGGGVIHDDDFVAEAGCVPDGREGLEQPRALVVDRNDD
jgi:hypothetical protein